MNSSELRQRARDALNGRWLVAIIAGLVASVLGGVSSPSMSFNFDFSSADFTNEDMQVLFDQLGINTEILNKIFAVIGALAVVGLVYAIIMFVIGSAVGVGYSAFNLDLVDGREAKLGRLFGSFGIWKTALVTNLLRGLYVALWSLLLIIPGIIASYSYAMTNYILAENPDMAPNDAIAASKEMMKGNKLRFFCLELSFIGWVLLSILTLGIGNIWLVPYMQASYAAFYRDIKPTEPILISE